HRVFVDVGVIEHVRERGALWPGLATDGRWLATGLGWHARTHADDAVVPAAFVDDVRRGAECIAVIDVWPLRLVGDLDHRSDNAQAAFSRALDHPRRDQPVVFDGHQLARGERPHLRDLFTVFQLCVFTRLQNHDQLVPTHRLEGTGVEAGLPGLLE